MARSDKTLEALPDYEKIKKAPSRQKVLNLLREAYQLRNVIAPAEQRMKEIKSELAQIQILNDLPGLRNGNICFIASERQGKMGLSKELLIDNNVPPEVIAASMVRGNPYVQSEIAVIGEPKTKDED